MTPSSPDAPRNHLRVEPFDPEIHVSPHALFRRLQDAAESAKVAPRLLDLRPPGAAVRFRGAVGFSEGVRAPHARTLVILVDDDGLEATRRARELREAGHTGVYALYGGMELYDYALDPLVVGPERFLAPYNVTTLPASNTRS